MVAVKLMQNWHNLKMMLFMRLLKTRIKVMKKLLGSLLLGARQLVATFNRYRDDHGIAITKVQQRRACFLNHQLLRFEKYLFRS